MPKPLEQLENWARSTTDLNGEKDNPFDNMDWAEEGSVTPVATTRSTKSSVMSLLSLGIRVIILGSILLPAVGKLMGASETEAQVTHGRTVKSSGDLGAATEAFQAVANNPDANKEWQAVAQAGRYSRQHSAFLPDQHLWNSRDTTTIRARVHSCIADVRPDRSLLTPKSGLIVFAGLLSDSAGAV